MIEKYQFLMHKASGRSSGPKVPAEQYAQLQRLVPDLLPEEGTGLPFTPTPAEDPAVIRMLEAIQQVGFDLSDDTRLAQQGIRLLRAREYTPADLIHHEYIRPSLSATIGQEAYPAQFDAEGVPYLQAPLTPRKCECGLASVSLLVRGQVKAALEKSGLKGLRLVQPQVISRKPVPEEERVWTIWSDAPLPPMLNLFVHQDRLYRYDASQPPVSFSQPYQGFLRPPELHYQRQAVQAVGAPDIGLTTESSGGVSPRRHILFSQRAVTFFREELGIALGGWPVHLVDPPHPPVPWVGAFPDPTDPRNACPAWVQEIAQG